MSGLSPKYIFKFGPGKQGELTQFPFEREKLGDLFAVHPGKCRLKTRAQRYFAVLEHVLCRMPEPSRKQLPSFGSWNCGEVAYGR
jgi:hypothetical protein